MKRTADCPRCGLPASRLHRIWYSWVGLAVQVVLWIFLALVVVTFVVEVLRS